MSETLRGITLHDAPADLAPVGETRIRRIAGQLQASSDGGAYAAIGGGANTSSGAGGWADYYVNFFRANCGVSDPRTEKVVRYDFATAAASVAATSTPSSGAATGAQINTSAAFKLTAPSAGTTGYAQLTNTNGNSFIGNQQTKWGIVTQHRITQADPNAVFTSGIYNGNDGITGVGWFGTQFGALIGGNIVQGLPGTVTPTKSATLAYNASSLYSAAVWSDGTNLYFSGYDGTTDTGPVLIGTVASLLPHATSAYLLTVYQSLTGTVAQPNVNLYQILTYTNPLP